MKQLLEDWSPAPCENLLDTAKALFTQIAHEVRAGGRTLHSIENWRASSTFIRVCSDAVSAETGSIDHLGTPHAQVTMHTWGVATAVRLVAEGRREFRVARALTESLVLTELHGLQMADVKFPYSVFTVRLPRGVFRTHNRISGWHDTCALWVAEWATPENDDRGRMLFVMSMPDGNEELPAKLMARSRSPVTYWLVRLRADIGVEDAIENYFNVRSTSSKIGQMAIGNTLVDAERMILRLVLNLAVYISLPAADVVIEGAEELAKLREAARKHPRGSYKRERADVKVKEASEQARIAHVGRSIVIPSQISEAAEHEHTATGRKLTASWLVRGHYRFQAIGQGRTARRLTWIRPHIRGRDLAEALAPRAYEAK